MRISWLLGTLFLSVVGFCKEQSVGRVQTPLRAIFKSILGTSVEFTSGTEWITEEKAQTKKCHCLAVLRDFWRVVIQEQLVYAIIKKKRKEKVVLESCFRPRTVSPKCSLHAPAQGCEHQLESLWRTVDLNKRFWCVFGVFYPRLRKGFSLGQQWRCWTHTNWIESFKVGGCFFLF